MGAAMRIFPRLKNNSKSARMSYVCDVDQQILDKFSAEAQKELGYAPATDTDFRKVLDAKDVDVITIAMPDHWHAPMAVWALRRESMSMSRSRRATIRAKASCLWRRSRNTGSWCRWAISSARRRTRSRLSSRFTMG